MRLRQRLRRRGSVKGNVMGIVRRSGSLRRRQLGRAMSRGCGLFTVECGDDMAEKVQLEADILHNCYK